MTALESWLVAPDLDHDYYAAASFDSSGYVTFYVKDLTAGTAMQHNKKACTITSLYNSSTDFRIGEINTSPSHHFAGIIDEVRFSNVVLPELGLLPYYSRKMGDADWDNDVDAGRCGHSGSKLANVVWGNLGGRRL